MGVRMKRSGEALVEQAAAFITNLSATSALGMIIGMDPIFKQFMVDEVGLDAAKVQELSNLAGLIARKFKNEDGIITTENCERFLKVNGAYTDEYEKKPTSH